MVERTWQKQRNECKLKHRTEKQAPACSLGGTQRGLRWLSRGAQLELHKWQCPSEFQDKNKKNLKKMQNVVARSGAKKGKNSQKGGKQTKTRRDEFQWRNVARVRGANAADNAGKAVRRPRQCSEAAVAALLKTSTHIIPPAHVLPLPLATPRLANWRSNPRRKTHVGGTSLIGAHNEPLPSLS